MRIMIPIHPAFLSEKGSNITQNERSYERSLKEVMKEVLKETDFKKTVGILEVIDVKGKITPSEAKEITGKSETTTWRYLNILVDTGYVIAEGNTNKAIYRRK